jgi:methylenetetrahydrofolate dehydrogenase (NADP+) / methenyltetrahydrofolate cyclohydrolase
LRPWGEDHDKGTRMAGASIIDGKSVAARVRADVAARVAERVAQGRPAPGLAVVLVGEDPASQVYVRNKAGATREVGMASIEHKLPASTGEDDLLALIADLNRRPDVNGILVQLPLPKHIDAAKVIEAIDPAKDVDGFHPLNVGRLAAGGQALAPCTPTGCLILVRSVRRELAGLEAVVIGRSNIVGKPMAQLLLAASCTVTIAHSRTRDLAEVCRGADILVAAVGRARMITGDMVKPGATVIDVGINRTEGGLVGDVDFASASEVAGAITPVPGGVGPMTIAMLIRNTFVSAARTEGFQYEKSL